MFFLFLQILANVLPGTTLHTDEWRCYVNAATWVAPPNAPYVHETVNHSINFVDPTQDATHSALKFAGRISDFAWLR
jgi:hypothetical protein